MNIFKVRDAEPGIAAVRQRLIDELGADRRVLWLLSGGSNIDLEAAVMTGITDKLTTKLELMLADERFGEAGHADSNWTQLMAAGFDVKQAKVYEVLQPGGCFEETEARYNHLAQQSLTQADCVVAQLGIGSDGHTAGILPNSPAASETTAWVVGYEAGAYQRLTLTFPALEHIQAAYVFAFGEAKRAALNRLTANEPRRQFPAALFKQLPEAYIYNDQIGGP